MKRFFEKRRRLEYLEAYKVDEITHLGMIDCGVPPRYLPLFWTACGNLLGLYFPREGGSPFVAGYDHEESILFPLSGDVGGFFKDPDLLSHDHPSNDGLYPASDWKPCRHLLVRPSARIPELELLKPMEFHYRKLESCDRDTFGRLIGRFGSSKNVQAVAIREEFGSAKHLNDRSRWIRLSKKLVSLNEPMSAIRALEACLTLQCIFPWYGDWPKEGSPSVSKDLEILQLLAPLVSANGDGFDKAFYSHQLDIVETYLRREKARKVKARK